MVLALVAASGAAVMALSPRHSTARSDGESARATQTAAVSPTPDEPERSPKKSSPSPKASPSPTPTPPPSQSSTPSKDDLGVIDHVVIIMQENRSFDHYFGVYESPSGEQVAGIPRKPNGEFTVCVPNPATDKCQKPYHYQGKDGRMLGGPHGLKDARRDIASGRMDGFIDSALHSPHSSRCAADPTLKICKNFTGPQGQPDVMSLLNREDIPNYWEYADWGVLQDHMFESVDSFSLPSHMFLVSGWAASCKGGPMTCVSNPQVKDKGPYMWTDLTYLLEKNDISWAYYVGDGTNLCNKWPRCKPHDKATATPFNWNPMPGFKTVRNNDQVDNVQGVSNFVDGLPTGDIPQVSWIIPGERVSEHPGHASFKPGHKYVTELVNAIGRSPAWEHTAIFISWDDWGGFYDHVDPPNVDINGYGLRVPGLVISPYAKEAYVDHQILSYDAYLKFIEDVFLESQRLDPRTDGRPDSRPTVREEVKQLGDLVNDFDFSQPPREPPILDPEDGS